MTPGKRGKSSNSQEPRAPARRGGGAGELNAKLAEALAHHQSGQLGIAEGIYRQILEVDPDHPRALQLLGVIGLQAGHFNEAVDLIERSIDLNPKDADAHNNLGQGYENLGRLDDAEMVYRKAITLKPEFAEAQTNLGNVLAKKGELAEAIKCHLRALVTNPGDPEVLCNLGSALLSQGKTDDAIARFRRAQEIAPEHPLILFNLGNALRDGGKSEEAIACYQRALAIDPRDPEVLSNLGSVLHANGSPDEAIAAFKKALEIDPDFVGAHYNLCVVYQDQGWVEEAFTTVRLALRLSPNNPACWRKWAEYISQVARISVDDRLFQELETYLAFETADIGKAGRVIQELVLKDKRLEALKRLVDTRDIPAVAENLSSGDGLRAVSTPLLLRFIPRSLVISTKLESFLTAIRRAFLHLGHEGQLGRIVAMHDGLSFLTALAKHCYLNEFVFFETVEETRQVEALVRIATRALEKGSAVEAALLVLIACYRPLGSLDNAPSSLERENVTRSPPLAEILQQQIREPEEERKIRTQIPRLTSINDEISQIVRKQYEENPYPRWLDLGPMRTASIRSILTEKFPHLKERTIDWPTAPLVLVAGCGSGREPILTACNCADASVLAIDLSLTSLAYAERKRRELGVDNLEFMQADIIELAGLERRFDIIQCGGVLHHMNNPDAGWRVLVDLLTPGGFMFVGLYSDHARGPVVAARSLIAEKGYRPTPVDIRRCRHDIMALADGHPSQALLTWGDFYTTSMCRDLIFHAQEHRFTIPEIKDALHRFGLEFIGFTDFGYRAPARYRERYPEDPHMTDLDFWDRFERENPDTFAGMYQFWTYKPGGKE